jgi:hypothetical protein
MSETPEMIPLDRHLFQDGKFAARRNVGATRRLPNDHPEKFMLNSPRNAWITLCAMWEHSPAPRRMSHCRGNRRLFLAVPCLSLEVKVASSTKIFVMGEGKTR